MSGTSEFLFEIFPIVIPIMFVIVFVAAFLTIFSPKFRGKMMRKQVQATKYMMDESKEDLKSISDGMAYATHDGIKSTARAIKEGFTEDSVYCKHCGAQIDSDSKFCNKCGKEQ